MPVLRNRLASVSAGGPRQFAELRERLMVTVDDYDSIQELKTELDRYDLRGRALKNAPVVITEPRNKISDTLERLRQLDADDIRVRQAIQEVSDEGDGVVETTSSIIEATSRLLGLIQQLPMVSNADFVLSYADYGPENLRISPTEMPTVSLDEAQDVSATPADLNDNLGLQDAWKEERGDEAIVAIFDTGFDKKLFRQNRIVDTFHGDSVNSVQAPAEGHGTMTAGAAAAKRDDDIPYNGAAPDSGVILVRITDDQGQIVGDIISKAWDWLMDQEFSKPVVANHSYGTPLCSGRPRGRFCAGPDVDVMKIANSTSDITSVMAAGNEAMRCGHRLSGITNGITGKNSIGEVITVGALRFDGRDAQRYSSHGRGDCAPVADPKPNVSCALPNKTYYGTEEGWEIKDMSTGIGGSSGGTSHASPTVAGMVALLQSRAVKERGEAMQTEEIKQILHKTSVQPRPTQINALNFITGSGSYDARFGYGQPQIAEALSEV